MRLASAALLACALGLAACGPTTPPVQAPPANNFVPDIYQARVDQGPSGEALPIPAIKPAYLRERNVRTRVPYNGPFDGEGLATAPRMIVEGGVLQGWTLDLATARKLGMESTANAVRGTSSPPSPGVTNVALTAGTASPQDLIRDMGRGLVVTSMLGASVNATTGDYSRGAAGFWVENGEIAFPVNECTIAGNLREMLMRITAANDLPDWRSLRVPSLLVEGMTVAGS